jgi:hypothetical protein
MESFVEELEAQAVGGFDAAEVESYMKETSIEPASLERYITFRSDHYTRNLVHKITAFELLVICWDIGQAAPVHGHEGELCWARVERGKLKFSNFKEVSEVPLVVEPVGDPVVGAVGFLDGPAHIHAVENPIKFREKAVSLHLYSQPYQECDIYDLKRGEKRRVQLSYDTMRGKPVVTGT